MMERQNDQAIEERFLVPSRLGDFGGVVNVWTVPGAQGVSWRFWDLPLPRIHWGLWDHVHRNPHVIPTAPVRTSKPRWAS